MTEIEQKALALIAPGAACEVNFENISILARAFTSAIEQHEAFRQEVSAAVDAYLRINSFDNKQRLVNFIIPAPKPDPLVQDMEEVDICAYAEIKAEYADRLRADLVDRFRTALDALGFEIREKKDDQ